MIHLRKQSPGGLGPDSSLWLFAMSLVVVGALGACATTGGGAALVRDVGTVFFDTNGAALTASDALSRFTPEIRHVYVGEKHGNRAYHSGQGAMLAALHKRGPVAVGVEWIGRDKQSAIDDFIAGRVDWEAFQQTVALAKRWGPKTAELQREILVYCKRHAIPVFGLNAPDGLARKVAKAGRAGVPEAMRRWLTPLTTGTAAHKAFFVKLMTGAGGHGGKGAHKMTPGMLDKYYKAQLVWDESMATVAAAALAKHPDRTLLVFAGLGHVDFGYGVPLRARKLAGGAAFLIVRPLPEQGSPSPKGTAPYPGRIADIFVRAGR